MKSKIFLLVGVLALMLIPAMGCVTDDSAPAASSLATQLSILQTQYKSLQDDMSSMRTEISKKADSSRVDALVTNGAGGNANTYTKDEVNNLITQAINKLKDEKPWGTSSTNNTSSTSSTNSTSSTSNNTLDTNGDIDLICERAPGDERVWVNDGIPVEWRLIVKNRSSSGTYFKMSADFDLADSGAAITSAQLIPSYDESTMQFSPSPFTSSLPVNSMSFNSRLSANEARIWIPKNSEQNLYLVLTVDYADATVTGKRWDWDFRIRQSN